MKNLLLSLCLVLTSCKNSPPVIAPPEVTPVPSASIAPPGTQGALVTYDPSSTIEKSFAELPLALMNKCYQTGKLKELWLKHKFVSFNCVFDKCPKTNLDAYNEYVKGAPYALNLRWYTSRPFSSVVGYTYNYYDNNQKGGKSETRIWSNTRVVKYYTAVDTAAHWAHELSHQVRAGGFVHYTIFDGSTPYEAGDIMEECLSE